ncbi:UNVERIFIED_CONTAM: hypothetical protein K2H54_059069 [Gekko kuhli]
MLQHLCNMGAGQRVMPSTHLKTSRIFRRVAQYLTMEEYPRTSAQPPQGPLTVSSGDTVSAGEHQAAQPRGPVQVPSGDAGEGQMSPHKDPGTCHGCAVLCRRLEEFETAVDNRFNQILGLTNTLTEVVEGLHADVSLQGTVQLGAAGLPP